MADIAGVTGGSAASAALGASVAGAGQAQVGKDAFLKLLVAQIKNQNPLNPSDGAQFVSQLAQFSELEQIMSIGSELTAMHGELKPSAADKAQATSPQGSV